VTDRRGDVSACIRGTAPAAELRRRAAALLPAATAAGLPVPPGAAAIAAAGCTPMGPVLSCGLPGELCDRRRKAVRSLCSTPPTAFANPAVPAPDIEARRGVKSSPAAFLDPLALLGLLPVGVPIWQDRAPDAADASVVCGSCSANRTAAGGGICLVLLLLLTGNAVAAVGGRALKANVGMPLLPGLLQADVLPPPPLLLQSGCVPASPSGHLSNSCCCCC
jgi:hypothetical protein